MGSLKPGATYIYERVDDTVYAREFGANPKDRFVIGYDYKKQEIRENNFRSFKWVDMMREARTNPALQKAIDHAILIYELSKDKDKWAETNT